MKRLARASRSAIFLMGVLRTLACPGAETLETAWQMALGHDRQLAAASADLEGARASERAALGARWPSLEAGGGYTRFDSSPALDVVTPSMTFRSGAIFKNEQLFSGNIQMRLPLYTGGQIAGAIASARSAVGGASAEEETATANLKLDVAEAYVAVLRARRALKAAESRVQSLNAHAEDVQQMVGRDLVPRSDLLAARVALANAEQARVRADNAVEIAQAAYNRRLGEPLDRSPDLDERVPGDASVLGTSVEELIRRALASRSELKSLTSRAEALASESRAEAGKRLPQVALTGAYSHYDNQILDRQNFATVGVGLTWSLFDGGQARNHAAALRSASRAAAERADDARSQIELEVRQSWLDVREAQARRKASSQAVEEAEENLRSSRELYGSGLATNTQVLDAVALQIDAVSNRDNAALDESLSVLRLSRAIAGL